MEIDLPVGKRLAPLSTCVFAALLGLALLLSASRAEAETLTIAVGDWPPYISQNQKHNGMIAHLIEDVFRAGGVEVEFRFLPWGRAYAEAAAAQFTATGVWMHKPEREADFLYSAPVLNEEFVFFHRRDRAFNWTRLEDLRGRVMGGGIKYSYGAEMDAALADGLITMERVNSDRQNFRKLLLGRIELYPQEKNVGLSALRKEFNEAERARITYHPKPFLNNQSFLLFPRKAPHSKVLLAMFNRQLLAFRQDGRYDAYLKDLERGFYTLNGS